MRLLGNLIWWIFGGLEAAVGYFTGTLALAVTIIGIHSSLDCSVCGLSGRVWSRELALQAACAFPSTSFG